MKQGRKALQLLGLAYAVFMIGQGLLGIATASTTAVQVILGICFCIFLAVCGLMVYKILKQRPE